MGVPGGHTGATMGRAEYTGDVLRIEGEHAWCDVLAKGEVVVYEVRVPLSAFTEPPTVGRSFSCVVEWDDDRCVGIAAELIPPEVVAAKAAADQREIEELVQWAATVEP